LYPYAEPLHSLLLQQALARSVCACWFDAAKRSQLLQGLAAGAFGSPDRWAAGDGEKAVGGSWERSIATYRSVVSYVLQLRHWLDDNIGGVMWFSFHAAHTSFYVPFPAGMPPSFVPASYKPPPPTSKRFRVLFDAGAIGIQTTP
jgi:hypothetical protein